MRASGRSIENLSVIPQPLFIKTLRYYESLFNININNDAATAIASSNRISISIGINNELMEIH